MTKIQLEIKDTGNHTANLVLFINALIAYARDQANLNAIGVSRLMSVFEESSKELK